MKFKHLESLQPGDIVDIVAPASAPPAEVLKQAQVFLKKWGLKARFPKDILKPHLFLAQSDERRFEILRDALLAEDSKAVWCLRGGYGSNRLIPQLWKLKKPSQAKIFIGISDIASVHLFLQQKWHWPTFHGSLLDRPAKGILPENCLLELRRVLFGEQDKVQFEIRALNDRARKIKNISSVITGGNMVTLQSSLGTKIDWQTKGRLLFFEEINERGYRIDRIFEQFSQTGKLNGCAGVILGHFLGGEEANGEITWPSVISEWAEKLPVPVFDSLESGHGENLRCLPLGSPAKIHSLKTFSSDDKGAKLLEVETLIR